VAPTVAPNLETLYISHFSFVSGAGCRGFESLLVQNVKKALRAFVYAVLGAFCYALNFTDINKNLLKNSLK